MIAVHPGAVLLEYLEVREWTKTRLADIIGVSEKTINAICDGQAPVTADIAVKLERVLHRPASLWLNLQSAFDLQVARRKMANEQ